MEENAALTAADLVVADDVRVASAGSLELATSDVAGDVIGHEPQRMSLVGSTHVGGDVLIRGARRGVFLSGITIDDDVRVSDSGAELGVTVQLSEIGGKAAIVGNTIVGEEFRSAFFVIANTVSGDLIFSRNDATNASEPSLVAANVVLHGDLVCRGNVPDVRDSRPGLETPNTVVEGKKIGQCADF